MNKIAVIPWFEHIIELVFKGKGRCCGVNRGKLLLSILCMKFLV